MIRGPTLIAALLTLALGAAQVLVGVRLRSSDSTSAEAIIAMAKTLKLDVIAEGVEDFRPLLQLQEHEGTRTQRFKRLIE